MAKEKDYKDSYFRFKCTTEEKQKIEDASEKHGIKMSKIVRDGAMKEIARLDRSLGK